MCCEGGGRQEKSDIASHRNEKERKPKWLGRDSRNGSSVGKKMTSSPARSKDRRRASEKGKKFSLKKERDQEGQIKWQISCGKVRSVKELSHSRKRVVNEKEAHGSTCSRLYRFLRERKGNGQVKEKGGPGRATRELFVLEDLGRKKSGKTISHPGNRIIH